MSLLRAGSFPGGSATGLSVADKYREQRGDNETMHY